MEHYERSRISSLFGITFAFMIILISLIPKIYEEQNKIDGRADACRTHFTKSTIQIAQYTISTDELCRSIAVDLE
jgi:hypothetical protein